MQQESPPEPGPPPGGLRAVLWREYRMSPAPLVLFGAFFVYVWLRVDTALLYFQPTWTFPDFSYDPRFLADLLAHPGGPAECVGALLSQFYIFPWAGALVLTAVAALLALAVWGVMRAVGGSPGGILPYVPALGLLLLISRYVHGLSMLLALLAAVLLAWAYMALPVRALWGRLVAFALLAALAYYAAGGGVLLFAGVCGLAELLRPGRRRLGLACLAVGAALPLLVGGLALELYPPDVYGRLLPLHRDAHPQALPVMAALYALFPLAVVVSFLRARRRCGGTPRPGARRRFAIALLVLAAGAAVAWFTFDRHRQTLLRMEMHARQRRWPEVLEQARQLPLRFYTLTVCYDVNRALYHTGRLASQMFRYPQHPEALLSTSLGLMSEGGSSAWRVGKLGDIMYELGRVNDAEHLAQESFEHLGRRPWILERLALLRLAKRQTEAARTFLRALARDPVHGEVGERLLQQLEVDPMLAGQSEVWRLRACMLRRNHARDPSVEELLQELLERNRDNRMAFEYLMAHYLLTRRLEPFVANLHRTADFGWSGLPQHYEEALLLYAKVAGRRVPGLEAVSGRTAARFEELARTLGPYENDMEAAAAAVPEAERGTYFYYYLFGPGSATP
jgi:tetratricopeptide (TPR) repeat protein